MDTIEITTSTVVAAGATIEITTNTADLLIDVLQDYVFKLTGDEHSDSATHPIEMALLDLLIEKKMAASRG